MITHDKMVEKMMTRQGYGWVLVGVKGCVLRPTGHSSVTFFPYLCQLRTGRCMVWAQVRLVALLSWIWLFSDRLIGGGDGGGPCTALSPGLRSGGLESKFGWGPRHPGQESDRLVLLMPGVQAGRVFLGYPARGIDSRIAGVQVQLVYGLAS